MEIMRNIDKAKELVDSNASFLSDWLERAREVRELEPYVQQAYQNTMWQRDSLYLIPDDAPDLNASVVSSLENSRNVFENYLPEIQKSPRQYTDVSSFNATVISGSSNTFSYLNQIYPNLSQDQQDRINSQIASYVELHQRQNRISTVKTLLAKLDQRLVDELELAEKELQHFKNRTSEVISPASALRNVLQHFKGQLLLRARNTTQETPNWSVMVNRLVVTGVSTPEHSTLEREGATHSQLYDRLSRILKGNLQATSTDMENIFIEVADHFYTVLSLVRL